MKKLVLAIVALGVLGGGGYGAYMFLLKKPAEAAIPKDAAAAEEHAAAEGSGDGHGGENGEKAPTFVRLDPLVVPIVDAEGASQVISMVIALEVKDEDGAKKVESLRPRIKDAFIQNLYGLMNSSAALDKGVVKVAYIKQRLNEISQKVMGEGVVQDVLLQTVQQTPM